MANKVNVNRGHFNSLTTDNATLSGSDFTGDVSIAGNLNVAGVSIAGNLNVTGVTTTVKNLDISDNIIGLNNGLTGSNANDSGIIIERGSTGNNAFIGWDESEDKFTVGTTTATAASTGNLTITTGTLVANLEGNVVGDITGNSGTVTQGVYTTSSVVVLNDVTHAGSGAIITSNERTKLTTIEQGADVTDAANVAASGAVMNTGSQTISGDILFTGTITTASVSMGGHLLPTANDTYDIGSAGFKIRDMYVSDSSLWVGDDHKISIDGGKMKFRKRKGGAVPASILAAGVGDAAAISVAALASAGKPGQPLTAMTLNDWAVYGNTLNVASRGIGNVRVQDIFADNADDYDEDTALELKADLASPALVTPDLGTPSAGVLTNCTFPTLNQSTTGNALTATTATQISNTTVPASTGATGTAGEIRYASGYIYVCVDANTWQRAALATWTP